MDISLIFFVLLVIILVGGVVLTLSMDSSGEKVHANVIKGTSFIPSQMFMGHDGLGGIAVNDKTHQICLWKNPDLPPHILHISRLAGSILVKNAEFLGEIFRTDPKSPLSFQKDMHSKVDKMIPSWRETTSCHDSQRIDLIIVIHEEDDPLHIVNFLDMETKKGGILYEKAMSTATHWYHVLGGLILQADQHARLRTEPDQVEVEIPLASVADELEKLGDLVEKNIITPQEFTLQKEKLLSAKI